MPAIVPVDTRREYFRIHRDLSVSVGEHRPGPPERIDGMTAGLITMERAAPHGGEVHPDGDEILVIVEGRIRVTGDSAPDAPLELGPGEACVIRAGEWHTVELLERTRLLHVSPGPHGDHRPP